MNRCGHSTLPWPAAVIIMVIIWPSLLGLPDWVTQIWATIGIPSLAAGIIFGFFWSLSRAIGYFRRRHP